MNQYLKDKIYRIPLNILNSIQIALMSNSDNIGVKRAKFLLKNGNITYQDMKRLKNFFDHFDQQINNKTQYALAGGELMRSFIETTLATDRNALEQSKKVKQEINVDPNLGTSAFKSSPNLNEEKKKELNVEDYDKLKKNALAVIVNNDNKFLLLKRSDYQKQWQPEKWSLVGGSVEKKEEPEAACSREIKEETGLDIKKFIEKVVIQRNPDSIEHIFACRYEGEPTDISLNKEHTNYGWFDINEIDYLDTVPNLQDYINLVFIKYS
jgi:8-oxo-dGTP pyrophosphatase MutT (NUDIX family)